MIEPRRRPIVASGMLEPGTTTEAVPLVIAAACARLRSTNPAPVS